MHKVLLFFSCLFLLSGCKKDEGIDDNNSNPSRKLENITSLSDYDAKIKEGVSLFFFHATWCSICANQRPAVEALTKDAALNKVFFGQVDFEKNQATNQKYNITGFPTIIIYKDNVERHRLSGQGHSQEKLAGMLKDLL